jgi:hypothetical protein
LVNLPADATLVALAVPFFVSAGAAQGTALALARSGAELYYLLDNATNGGPPVWVHEGEVERCVLAPVTVRRD